MSESGPVQSWTPEERAHVESEEVRALRSECPKCGAHSGSWCTDWATMHYERWGYGSLSTPASTPTPDTPTPHATEAPPMI